MAEACWLALLAFTIRRCAYVSGTAGSAGGAGSACKVEYKYSDPLWPAPADRSATMINQLMSFAPAICGLMRDCIHNVSACSPFPRNPPTQCCLQHLACGRCRALPRPPAGQDLPRSGLVSRSLPAAALAAPQALVAVPVPAQARALLLGVARAWGPPAAAVVWAWPADVRSTEHVTCCKLATRMKSAWEAGYPRDGSATSCHTDDTCSLLILLSATLGRECASSFQI